jgi:hypothetical protein
LHGAQKLFRGWNQSALLGEDDDGERTLFPIFAMTMIGEALRTQRLLILAFGYDFAGSVLKRGDGEARQRGEEFRS